MLNSVQMRRPQEAGGCQTIIEPGATDGLSQLEFELQFSCSRSCPRSENQLQTEGLGPQDPGCAAQQNEEEVLLESEELGVNMWQSVPSPTHLSHITNINPFATLSRIKCERYIFLKKCVRSSLLLIMFPHVYVYV